MLGPRLRMRKKMRVPPPPPPPPGVHTSIKCVDAVEDFGMNGQGQ